MKHPEPHLILKWLTFLTALTILLIATQAKAADHWSKADIQREVACIALNVADGVTTSKILDDNNRAFEAGPAHLLFGDRPSQAELAGVVVISSAIHAVVTHYIPSRYRQYWQYSWIGIKAMVIGNNLKVGIGIQF